MRKSICAPKSFPGPAIVMLVALAGGGFASGEADAATIAEFQAALKRVVPQGGDPFPGGHSPETDNACSFYWSSGQLSIRLSMLLRYGPDLTPGNVYWIEERASPAGRMVGARLDVYNLHTREQDVATIWATADHVASTRRTVRMELEKSAMTRTCVDFRIQ
jgi:hypothetical protein